MISSWLFRLSCSSAGSRLCSCGTSEEPPPFQQRDEGPDHVPFGGLGPGDRVENRRRRDALRRRPDQRPPAAVGGQAQLDLVVAAQLSEPVCRGGGPVRAADPGDRGTVADQPQQPYLPGFRVGQRERGDERDVVLGNPQREPLKVITLDGAVPAEQLVQDVSDPGVGVPRRIFLPLPVLLAEAFPGAGAERFQVRPFGSQDRDGQERAGDLDQLQPVDVRLPPFPGRNPVVLEARARSPMCPGARGRHRVASCLGTAKITATGKLCGRTSR